MIIGFDHGLPCRVKNMTEVLSRQSRGLSSRFLSLVRFEGHVIHISLVTVIKYYHWCFCSHFIHNNMNFIALKWPVCCKPHGKNTLFLCTGCQETQIDNCYGKPNTCLTKPFFSHFNRIVVASIHCTMAVPSGPCLQHITGNTSWLNQLYGAFAHPKVYCQLFNRLLTHWGRDNMVAILQTIYSNHTLKRCALNVN